MKDSRDVRGTVAGRRSTGLVCLAIGLAGCGSQTPNDGGPGPATPALSAESRATIERFCGDCHRLPLASGFPRDRWPAEVRQGYDFYLTAARSDLKRPVERDAIRFFQDQAPERLSIPRAADRSERPTTIRFVPAPLSPAFTADDPAIAAMFWRQEQRDMLVSDMRRGRVERWTLTPGAEAVETVAELRHPCRIVPLNTTGEGGTYLVSDLGSFLPADHADGSLWWLEESATGFTSKLLRDGLARIVEARPIDGEATTQVVVAEFGWRSTGALRIVSTIRDISADRVLDPRHGVVSARVADMDGDGRADIVAAFGQEHETVDVYWNRGDGAYEHAVVHAFPDPSWGTSGCELADIDGDGRIDILHANGDTLDSGLAKPYHGVRWLRNLGDRSFEVREIGLMPGVCQASAADLDGDGDLDVVACSLHQAAPLEPAGTYDSLAWFEQQSDGTFAPHSIERDSCNHTCFALADIDGDARIDLIAGTWQGQETRTAAPAAVIYRNLPVLLTAAQNEDYPFKGAD